MFGPKDQAEVNPRAGLRLFALGLSVLALSSCSPKPVESDAGRIPSGLETRFYAPEGWTWASVTVKGAAPIRYGVASPSVAARGQVLILTGRGEPAESYFELIGELIARRYIVWVLEGAGQGGSMRDRLVAHRAHAPSADVDVAALDQMVREVIRPKGEQPLVLIADDLGATTALRSLGRGLAVSGAVLDIPALASPVDPATASAAHAVQGMGLGRTPVFGVGAGAPPAGHDPVRAGLPAAWAKANPGLKLEGATWGWVDAVDTAVQAARDPAALKRIKPPVLMTVGQGNNLAASAACKALPHCKLTAYPGGRGALHLEADAVRKPWLDEATALIDGLGAGVAVAAPPRGTH